MKTVLSAILLVASVFADNTALFASIKGVEKGDFLNVREAANYQSKKVAAIPSFKDMHLTFGIESCKKVKTSIWCSVYPLMQNGTDSFKENDKGWVNARYLTFSNHGYVLVDGKGNCEYALGCKEGKCELVADFRQDNNGEVVSMQTKWVERERLKGESSFGAMNPNEDGYCNIGMYIEDYLKKKNK